MKLYENLTVLVIGLGSMGKRRVRNLQALGVKNIVGFDLRQDRREEAKSLYGIEIISSIADMSEQRQCDAWVISLPPNIHHIFMKEAQQRSIPCFVEASVLDTDFDFLIAQQKIKNTLIAPSCTLLFHPAIKKIIELVKGNELGVITNIIYHSGQYLPDWHTYEPVKDYYVSNPETGGAREIVPFELTWITHLFGFPKRVAGLYKKTIDIEGAENIEDTYNVLLDYNKFIFNLNVDVVSRIATRRLVINGSEKQLFWNWEDDAVKVYNPQINKWQNYEYQLLAAQKGYNKNISEQMYIEEMEAYLNAVKYGATYPNTLQHDQKVLSILYKAEKSDREGAFMI